MSRSFTRRLRPPEQLGRHAATPLWSRPSSWAWVACRARRSLRRPRHRALAHRNICGDVRDTRAGMVRAFGAPIAIVPVLAVADLPTVISNATTWLVGILATLATFFLTLGGARYLSAGGDPAEVEKAKTALRSAGIGYGLALLAPVILKVLQQILGAG